MLVYQSVNHVEGGVREKILKKVGSRKCKKKNYVAESVIFRKLIIKNTNWGNEQRETNL